MGSSNGNCYWCRKYQRAMHIPGCIGEPLCGGCIKWFCNRADNPERLPPQPDGRTITSDYLKRLFHQKPYSNAVDWRVVAECLRDRYEPGCRNPITGQGVDLLNPPVPEHQPVQARVVNPQHMPRRFCQPYGRKTVRLNPPP